MVRKAGERTWRLYFGLLLWTVCAVALVVMDLGSVATILSILLALRIFGFREKWSEEGLSAYSVFNPGVHAIPGTLSADHLDRQLRGEYGSASQPTNNGGQREMIPASSIRPVLHVAQLTTPEERERRREAQAAAAEKRKQSTGGTT
jgi:hypothetical protein